MIQPVAANGSGNLVDDGVGGGSKFQCVLHSNINFRPSQILVVSFLKSAAK